jgi:heat shock protein HtpX
MATLYTEQTKNVEKTWALMVGFFVAVIAIGYVFSYVYNSPAILVVAVALSIIMNFASYWFSDKIALSSAGAIPVEKSQAPDLYNVVENLSITAGIPMPKLYVINDPAPNAFATGRNKEHAAVAVTTGLLQIMNKTELEGVIGHELSHIGNRDILLSTVVVVLVGFITLLSDFFLRSRMFFGNGRSDREGGNAGMIMFLIGIVLAILSPIAATLIQLAISRKRELLADTDGVLLTRYPEGLISALKKLEAYSQPMARANNATAHMFISNPFGANKDNHPSFISKLFMTHPPIEERIKALQAGE